MAIYTHLSRAEIQAFVAQYNIGTLEDYKGISEGVTNTNYVISVIPRVAEGSFAIETDPSTRKTLAQDKEHYILTLFENHYKLEDLPYFVSLMEWFAARGIDCPQPIKMRDGRVLAALAERPALMVSFLQGAGLEPRKITPEHLFQLGAFAAKMHIAGMGFPHSRKNPLSIDGWEMLVDGVLPRADEIELGLADLIREEYNYLSEHWPSELPSGPIHADLFPDNVFFREKKLTGIIDWYFACHDAWAYDVAIMVNAWCFDVRHKFVPERAQALMHSYNEQRSLTPEEDAAMPLLLRGAALRFLLTRAHDWLNPPEGADITLKDPLEYARKLEFFQSYKP